MTDVFSLSPIDPATRDFRVYGGVQAACTDLIGADSTREMSRLYDSALVTHRQLVVEDRSAAAYAAIVAMTAGAFLELHESHKQGNDYPGTVVGPFLHAAALTTFNPFDQVGTTCRDIAAATSHADSRFLDKLVGHVQEKWRPSDRRTPWYESVHALTVVARATADWSVSTQEPDARTLAGRVDKWRRHLSAPLPDAERRKVYQQLAPSRILHAPGAQPARRR